MKVFMLTEAQIIQQEYKRIQQRVKEDPGTAGDQGEENWAKILRGWLPTNYHVVTKGRILSEHGISSPQVDILVLYPFYPTNLLDKKYYLAAGVAAAFECKITLRTNHIVEAIKKSAIIKKLRVSSKGDFENELFSPIIYGVLAHSHNLTGTEEHAQKHIVEIIESADNEFINHPADQLDVLCISDLGFWAVHKSPLTTEYQKQDAGFSITYKHGPTTWYMMSTASLYGMETEPYKDFSAIGALIVRLLRLLSKHDPSLRELASYFRNAIGGSSTGKGRGWPENTLSVEARYKIDQVNNKALLNELTDFD